MSDQEDQIDDDDDDRQPSNMEVCFNVSAETVKFEIDGTRYRMKPGDRITLNVAYTRPSVMMQGRDPVQSVVERLTSRKVLPASHRKLPAQFKKLLQEEAQTS
jgi:hypothetical protein